MSEQNMQLPQLLLTEDQKLGVQGIQVFVACDPVYFHEHAIFLAYSLDTYSPHHSLHFHIFGQDKTVFDEIQRLKSNLNNTSITYSHEGVNFHDKNSTAIYCSCVRFIRLTQLISHFKIPMLSLDADSLVVNSITNLNGEFHDADISLKTRFHAKQVQFKFLTSTVFFKPTQATFSFLQHFSQLIANAITTGKAYWYLDQVSFYQASQVIPNLKIQDISTKYADWEFEDTSYIWAGKGNRKYKDSKYLKMVEKINSNLNFSKKSYFVIPETSNIENYIFLQRTDYPKQVEKILIDLKLTKTNPFYSPIKKAILGKIYYDDIYKEFETIKSYLPKAAVSLLDIGCGISGIDILLDEFYSDNNCLEKITLLDKEGQSKIYYNFEQDAAYYNSLMLAEKFLRVNNVKTPIYLVDILKDSFPTGKFDIIISLISWGFHYPVSTYLDVAYKNLSEEGILILDVRKNQGQEDLLARKFGNIKAIHDLGKAQRFLVKKTQKN